MIIFLIWIPVILIFYLKNWVQINTKCYCLSSRVFLESLILLFCRPNNQKSLTQKDGENDFLLQFIQYKASLSLDFLHEKFLDQEVLMELAVIEWAAKWKLFNPFFFFPWSEEKSYLFCTFVASADLSKKDVFHYISSSPLCVLTFPDAFGTVNLWDFCFYILIRWVCGRYLFSFFFF